MSLWRTAALVLLHATRDYFCSSGKAKTVAFCAEWNKRFFVFAFMSYNIGICLHTPSEQHSGTDYQWLSKIKCICWSWIYAHLILKTVCWEIIGERAVFVCAWVGFSTDGTSQKHRMFKCQAKIPYPPQNIVQSRPE